MADTITPSANSTYHLYTFPPSACAQRIRIALALKQIPHITLHNINMMAGEHLTETYRALNPSGKVPALVIETRDDASAPSQVSKITITQSTAILEYLDELFPTPFPLFPAREYALQRARVRELVGILTQDMFPYGNRKIAMRIRRIRGSVEDQSAFVTTAMIEGLDAYEGFLKRYGGRYSVGEEVTMADVCLVPQVAQAERSGLLVCGEGSKWPLVRGVVERLGEIEAFGAEMRVKYDF